MRFAIFVSVVIPGLLMASVVPAGFVENAGQVGGDVIYYTLDGMKVYRDGRISYGDVELRLPDANLSWISGEGAISRLNLLGGSSTFRNLNVYRRVVFREVYPGVDFVITPMDGSLEFQWFVRPGARVEDVVLEVLKGEPDFSHVRAFQGSREVSVSMRREGNLISFDVEKYDRSETLVIDPIAFISTNINEMAYGMNVDDSGNVYVTGYVSSTAGMGDWDMFISKLSPDLDSLLITAIIYGDTGFYDLGFSVDFDPEGNVYIAGWTFDTSGNFGGNNVVYYGSRGVVDAFVMKLTPSLDSIITTAIVTSPFVDQAFSVYYHNDTVYIGGVASDADNFSVSRTVYGSHSGAYDMNAFVTALSPDLASHYATVVIASPGSDYAEGMYAGEGRIYVFGYTYDPAGFSSDRVIYGTTGNGDAFVSVLSSDLSQHEQSIIVASDSLDVVRSVLELDSGRFVVAGFTLNSSGFSTDRTIQGPPGKEDIFLTLLDSTFSPVRTLILASPSTDLIDYGSDRSLAMVDGKLALYASSDYVTALGGSIERNMCGTGGGKDALILWMYPSLDSAFSMSVFTGNGNDDASGDIVYNGSGLYFAGSVPSSYDPDTYYGPTYSYGTQDESDVFGGYLEGDCIPVRHKESAGPSMVVRNGLLRLNLNGSAYVGFDVFDAAGRRVLTRSAGYLLPGEYAFPLNVPSGVYMLKIRIGDDVMISKFVR